MSEKALELVRNWKHLPGKHPQKSHAGGRGGGSSGGSSEHKKGVSSFSKANKAKVNEMITSLTADGIWSDETSLTYLRSIREGQITESDAIEYYNDWKKGTTA